MNVSLTPELEKFVAKEVDSGLYQTASEVIRAALRKLQETKRVHPCEIPNTWEELEARLLESAASFDRGEGVDGKIVFQRLRRKIKARLRG
jgi:antitoxin ParD1/3/4